MKYDAGEYDIAVVGAGHAGCEAKTCCCKNGNENIIVFYKFGGCGKYAV